MESIETLAARMKEEFRFFRTLSESDLFDFIHFSEEREISAGETLWCEGDHDNYAAFILSGRLNIKKKTEFEGKHVIVGVYGKGSVVGELCLLTNNVRSVTAEIMESATLLILSSKNFEKLVEKNPRLGLSLLRHIFLTTSRRLRRSYERIGSIF